MSASDEQSEKVVTADEAVGSTDVRTGYLSGPGFTDVPVRYSVVDGHCIFDGCIDMGTVAEVEQHADEVRARLGEAASTEPTIPHPEVGADEDVVGLGVGLPPSSSFLWTNGTVPYVVDAGLPNANRVQQAIQHIHANTSIRFVPRSSQSNSIRFERNPNSGVSWSKIGMRGGEQSIRLSDNASMGTVVHECCHALGLMHEQGRCDRDKFVDIKYENIIEKYESQFDKFCAGYMDYFDYDYDSIMHYRAKSFSKNGKPTIVPLKKGAQIGQRDGLSFGDRITIAHMYERFTGAGHTGVWRAGSGKYGLWVNASWDSFIDRWKKWAELDLRLVDVNVRRVGNQLRYSGVFLPGTGAYALWANASWDSFINKWKELSGKGLRLVDLHVRWDGSQNRYTGVFLPGTGAYALWANASWTSFISKWKELSGKGLRLVDINVHRSGSSTRYSGVFLQGGGGYYLWANAPWESFRARWQQLASKGLRLVDYEFTEPFGAASAALDIAGTPMELSEEGTDAVEVGGAFDGSGEDLSESPPADSAQESSQDPIGQGAYVDVAAGSAPGADDAGGHGAAVLIVPTDDGEPEDSDGVGDAVFDVDEAAPSPDSDLASGVKSTSAGAPEGGDGAGGIYEPAATIGVDAGSLTP